MSPQIKDIQIAHIAEIQYTSGVNKTFVPNINEDDCTKKIYRKTSYKQFTLITQRKRLEAVEEIETSVNNENEADIDEQNENQEEEGE